MSGGLAFLGVLLGGLLLFCGAAAAQSAEKADNLGAMERAEQHYRMAVQFYGQGRYRESVEEFDMAIALHDDPVMHCNRAVPLIRLGELREATQSLRLCRDSYAEEDPERAVVDAEVAALSLIIDIVSVRSLEMVGAIGSKERGERAVVVAPTPQVEPIKGRRVSGKGVAGMALIGAGALAGVGAAVLDMVSAPMVEEFREQSRGGIGTSPGRHEELRLQIQQRQRLFWGLTGAGVAVASVGAGLIIWELTGAMKEDARAVSLQIGRDQFAVELQLRF